MISRRSRPGVDGQRLSSGLARCLPLLLLLLLAGCVQRDVLSVTIGSVIVQPGTASLLEGESQQFTATVEDENGLALRGATVTWSAEDPERVVIDADGMGTAVGPGSTTVTATFRGVVGQATVTIIAAPEIEVEQDSVRMFAGVGGPPPPPLVLEVNNGGGGSLRNLSVQTTHAPGGPAGWLTATLEDTDAPTELTLVAATDSLPAGDYSAQVALSSPDDPDSPLLVAVSLSVAGISIIESGGGSAVAEAGGTDDFQVSLDAAPDSAVVIDILTGNPAEVVATPATLTFLPTDWDQPQTVLLTGQDETVSDGDQMIPVTLRVDDDASDPRYQPVDDQVVTVTVVDDDAPSFSVTETGGSTSVAESGTTDQLSVVLDVEPLSPVVLDVSWSDSTEVAAGPSTLTFTPADWATAQTVTVTGVDDDVIDGSQSVQIEVSVVPASSDDAFDTLAPEVVSVSNADDDAAGFTVTESAAPGPDPSFVTEGGSIDDFTVVLDAEPASNVTLSVVSDDPGEVTVTPPVLVFTPANWDTPQTVTLTGIDDDLIDGDQSTDVTVAVDPSSDDDFDPLPDFVLDVTTADDESAGFVVTETGGGTSVTEAGSSDTFSVALTAEPVVNVVMDLSSDATDEATLSASSLTFTPANWNVPQTVTVTGVDELIDDGDQLVPARVSVNPALSDDDFDTLPPDSVVVTVVDDDTAGFVITQTAGGTLVTESGSTDSITVVLTSEPVQNVVVTLTASDAGEATVSPTTLTFTPADWNVSQTATITGVDDIVDDGDQFSLIAVAISAALSDDAYDPLPDQTVPVTTTDDDSPAGFTVTAIGGTTVTEGGGTDDFTVVLDAQPASNVVFDLSTDDATESSLSAATLTFTPADWNVQQTVTVTGVDDSLVDGPQSSTVTVAVNAAASDDTYDPLPDQTVAVTTTDDDVAGFTLAETNGSTLVGEGGSSDTVTVVLDAQPFSNVVISVASGDLGELTVSPAQLTFTPGNWNVAQTVTFTGVDDALLDGTQSTIATFAVVDGLSDDNFDAIVDQTVTAQTTDNDQPGLTIAETGGSTVVTEAGSTDDFTVVLNAQPSSAVVLTVTSGDPGEVTVFPATLTFDDTDWSVAQSVVLTGVDDNVIDPGQITIVTVAVDDANSDDAYDPVPDATVSVTTTDDDAAGFTLVESGPGTSVTEAGSTDDFTAVLDAQPASAVVLLVTSPDPGEVTVSPTSLTFTPTNWNVARTVTLTGVDDAVIDGNVVTAIDVSVDPDGSDDGYDAVPSQTVLATTVDDDLPGFTVTETGGGTLVSESGGQDVFTVVLDASPAAGLSVVMDLTTPTSDEAVVSPTSLTFTDANWNVAQTVTVTGVNDPIIDGNQTTVVTIAVNAAQSDDDFDGLPSQTVTVTTTDDDMAGFALTQTGGSTSVNESGSTDTFTALLLAQPSSNVVLTVSSGDPGEATVAPATLTFTPADWNIAQTVTVTGVDDLVDDGDLTTTITVAVDDASSDDDFDPVPDQTLSVTTIDDDQAGFVVTVSGGGTLVTEAGSTDDFTVVLTSEPVSNVVIDVVSGDVGEAVVSPAQLTFTPANWSTPQMVTVTGVDDLIDDGSQFTNVTISINTAGSDDTFDSVLPQVVSVTTTDDDAPAGMTVTAIGGLTVTESGSTDDFTVVLDAEPATNVVLTVTSADPGEATVTPATLTFTPVNWNVTQTVTVTGVDDAILDGGQSTTLTVAVDDANSDDAYDPVPDETLTVTTTDDDVAGFSVTETGGSTVVNETGTTDQITVVLDAEPAAGQVVEIDITSSDVGEVTVSPATLTFTPANWSVAQTVTATGVDDLDIDGSQASNLTFAVDAAASDDDFDALPSQVIVATTTDNDAPGITVAESGGSTSVDESGTIDDFTVVLNSGPLTNVVVTVSSGDTDEATVAPVTLTFTPADWSTPQMVTVTGIDDALVDGSQLTTITIAVDDAQSDDTYDGLSETLSVTTTDDDGAGFTITETGGGTSVTEAGSTDQFSVVLDAQPATAVSLTLTSADLGEATVSPATLTFTNSNWNIAQTATVTGVDDALIDGNQSTLVTVSVDVASSSPEYGSVPDQTVSVTTLDDDLAGFTISESGGGTLVNEAGSTDGFTVVLNTEPTSNVVLTVVSGDTGEATVSPASLTFTSANWSVGQTVTVTGVDDAIIDGSQLTLVTVAVDDANSDDDFDPVPDQTVSVTTVDDDAGDFVVAESGGTTSVGETSGTDDFTVVLTAEPSSNVVITVTSADPGETAVSPATLTFTPADWNVAQTVIVTGADDLIDDGDQTTLVTISVDDANSDDAFDPAPDQSVSVTTVDDDQAGMVTQETGGGTLVTEGGSTDEFTVVLTSQPLTNVVLTVTSGDTGEATVAPGILTFTPADWSTAQTVTVTGVDDLIDDGTQFTVVAIAVDDAQSDDAYDPVLDSNVSVTTTDDDAPAGMTVTAIGGLTVSESGSTDDFTVVLDAEPATNVVLTVTSADPGEATVTPATLTFTPVNWNVTQTVTVTGVDDAILDGGQSTTLTVAVDDANSDDAYDPVPDETLTVTTTDDDVAGFSVTETGGSTVVNETGTTDQITVVLDAEPAAGQVVEIDITSNDVGEVTVSPATLTFTPANWNVAQTVTVTGVDDALVDGSQASNLTFAVDAAASDDDFDALPSQVIVATTTDNDAPGITVAESGGSTSVDESGTIDDFTVVLNSQPSTNVVVTVSSGDTGEATVAPATLTFTSADWSTPQMVTVTGIDDALVDGSQLTTITIAVDDAQSDDTYDGLSETLSVTTTDDDGAGFTITETGGGTSVTEAGSTDQFSVVLDAQPATAVSLTLTSADLGEATVSPATLTFTNSNWNIAQTATVTGVDDALIDGNQSTLVTVSVDVASSSPEYGSVPDQTVSVTTLDDDLAGFTISESGGGTLVNEAGSTDGFTVVLNTEPTSNVVLTVVSGDTGEATVSPASLTFTPANWSVGQTVTVTGVDDAIIDGSQLTLVTVAVDDANSDDDFDPVPDQTVSVTTVDDDGAGFVVSESGGSTGVDESGTTDTFTVVLTAEPSSNVVITVTSADPGETAVSPATLTFTPADWNVAQTVTVTGVDDLVDDGTTATLVTVAVDDANSDNAFDPLPDQTVTVTTTDDDTAGVTIVETGGTTVVSESGTTDQFTVVLDTEPTSNVVIDVTSGDAGEATVAPAQLVFTPADWNTAQTVTVTGVDDLVSDGNQFTPVTVAVNDGLSDNVYDPIPNQTVTATTTDDDLAGFTITQTGGGTAVSESGTTDTFDVVLTAQPGSNVVLTVTSSDTGEATVSPAALTFTTSDWNTPQTVTVTGVDDLFDDGDQFTLITVSVDDANSDDAYDLLADQTVSVTTVDDDGVGFTVVESGGSTTVDESGTVDDFTVVLDAQPATNVVIDVVSGDTGEATVSPATLTFTSANWNVAQTVNVSGVDDLVDDGDVVTLVTISIDDGASDPAYGSVSDQTVGVTTLDDDGAGLTIVESGGSSDVDESGTTDTFTVELDAQPVSDVVLTVVSGDTGEVTVSPATLTFTSTDWNTPQTVTVTGVDDPTADGPIVTTVVVAVDDGLSDDAYDAVPDETVAVTNADNDTAGFTVAETGGTTVVTEAGSTDQFTVVLDAQPTSTVVLDIVSGDPSEATVSASNLVFSSANWNTPRTVTVTGVNDAVDDGDQLTTITVSVDAGASDDAFDALAPETVTVTTSDDDTAGFTISESGGTTMVSESATTDEFTVVLTSEPTSNVVFTVTSDDPTESSVAPATLTFTPGNWNAAQTVTVTGVDDALVDGTVISSVIVSVDDASSDDTYDPLPDASVSVSTTDDDGAGFLVTESGPGSTVTEAGGTDTFDVVLTAEPSSNVVFDISSADTGEVTAAPASLTFTPANWSTPQTVTLTGVDDTIEDGDQVTTVSVSVNDAASDDGFDPLPDQVVSVSTLDDDDPSFVVTPTGGSTVVSETGTTDDIGVVLGVEPASDVVITVVSGDPGEATVSPTSLTFTPANWNVTQVVTVTGVDDVTVDGPQATLVTFAVDDVASDDAFDALADQSLSVTTTDDDAGAFTVVEAGGTTVVTEGGGTDSFTLVLDRQPLTNVVFDVVSADLGEVTVSTALVTFTPANWNVAQTVTVTGVDDAVQDGNQTTTVTVSVNTANSDDAWDGLAASTVSVTTTDDDTAGFTVIESGGSTDVGESGTTDTFTVVLDAQPSSNVEIDVTSADTGEATVSPVTLVFTAADWSTPQTVTVTGVDDFELDGTTTTLLTLSVDDAASDDAYDPVPDQTVSVSNGDDDVAGFTVAETGGTSVSEAATTDNFTVVLDAEPASDVEITVVSADVGEAIVDQARLTFTPANWSVAQTVTVTGVDDAITDGNQTTLVTLAVDPAASDDAFDALPSQTVSVTTLDDDAAGFTIAESGGGTTVTEAGSTDEFTVVLNTQPTTNVVLDVVSGDIGEATVDVSTLTFTSGNWNVAQTVTVTGVGDLFDDGNQVTSVTISVDDALSDDGYDPVPDQTVFVTTTDDDIAGFTIQQSGGGTLVSETGTNDTFTVVLTAQPVTNVELTVTADDPSEVSVAPTPLTFTTANWNVAQTVTVTGVDDALVDGVQFSTVTIAVDDAASDDAFDPLNDQTVSVTTTDDDGAAYTVTESGGSTDVAESGTTDTFTIVLDAQPLGDVVLDLVSGDPSEATVSPVRVTFNNGNWNVAQTITATGVDDAVVDPGNTSVVTISVNQPLTDDGFDAMGNQTVTVNVTDDDVAGFVVSETSGSTSVTEAGSSDAFTVVLTAQPISDVVIDVVNPDPGEISVDQTSLTFSSGNWNVAQTVTVTGVDDVVDDGDVVTNVSLSINDPASDDTFDPVADQSVAVTTLDDETAGLSVVESGGTTAVTEPGSTDTFTIVLQTQPTSDVVLDITSGDLSEATVSPAQLTFTSTNWNSAQTVTVTAVDDDVDDGNQSTTVTVAVNDGLSDDSYDPVSDVTVIVSTVDDDASGFVVTESGGSSTVDESGTTDTFTVVLTSQPVGSVVLDVSSADVGEVSVSPAQLTFTSGNWNVAQTVTLTGVDDGQLVDGNATTNVSVSVATGLSDPSYASVPTQQVAVTTTDDDLAGFTVTESGGSTSVTESGGSDSFTVVLDAQPASNVVFDVTSGDTGEATVSPTQLTFTSANWSAAQTVTVTGQDDSPLLDGNQVTTITIAVDDIASNDAFDLLADQTVAATTVDDDVAGFTVSETGGTTSVSESGTTDVLNVVLDAQPTSNVVIDVSSGDTGEVTVSPATLTFTSGNWSTPQSVTLTGVGDSPLTDGDQITGILFSVDDALSYDPFDAVPDTTIQATTLDIDVAGILVTESGLDTTVGEGGSTDTFTVQLTAQPATAVTLTVVSDDTGEATVDQATLLFTTIDWNVAQTVTVTGIDDGQLVDGPQTTTVTIAVDDAASDDEYDPVADETVSVTTTDDDVASFTVTESGGSTSVDEDGAGNTDTFTVVLDNQPGGNVVVDVSSGSPGEAQAAPTSLVFTTSNWNVAQTVTVTGQDDTPFVDGPQLSTITLAVNDGLSDDLWDPVADQTVSVTTNDTDIAAFSITETGGNTVVNEDDTAGNNTDTFTVQLDAQPNGSVTFDIGSDDTGEATVSPVTLTFDNSNWNTPQVVTVTGTDDNIIDATQNSTTTVSVNQPATTPLFDGMAAQTVSVATLDDDVAGFTLTPSGATVVTEAAGAGNIDDFTLVLDAEPASNVVLNVQSGDLSEFTVSPATVTFTPANWSTPQTVTITGVDDDFDDGDQTAPASVTVNAAASDDDFDAVSGQDVTVTTIDDDAVGFTVVDGGGVTVSESGTNGTFTVVLDIEPASAVVFDINVDDASEASRAPATLTFTPADWNTPQTVTITGVDDSIIDGSIGSLATVSVNDAASDNAFDPLADQTVSITTTDDDVAGFTVVESGNSTVVDESGTTDDFTVVLDAEPQSNVVVLVSNPDPGEISLDQTSLTFTTANWSTPQTVNVTGQDDALADGDVVTAILLSIDDANSDNDFDAVADQTVDATTMDDESASFTVTEVGGTTITDEDGTPQNFTVVLDVQPETDVVFNITNPDLTEITLDATALTFTTANWASPQNVQVTGVNDSPDDDGDQLTTITISVDDAQSADPFDALPDQTVVATTTDLDPRLQ